MVEVGGECKIIHFWSARNAAQKQILQIKGHKQSSLRFHILVVRLFSNDVKR